MSKLTSTTLFSPGNKTYCAFSSFVGSPNFWSCICKPFELIVRFEVEALLNLTLTETVLFNKEIVLSVANTLLPRFIPSLDFEFAESEAVVGEDTRGDFDVGVNVGVKSRLVRLLKISINWI